MLPPPRRTETADVLALALLDLAAGPRPLELQSGRRGRRGCGGQDGGCPADRRRHRGGHRSGHAQGEEPQAVAQRRTRLVHHLAGHAGTTAALRGLEELDEHAPLRRERRREPRLLPADGEQHDVAPERLPPPREARPGHGSATAPQGGPVLVVGRGVLLGHLEQHLRPPGQGEDRARVEPPCLQVQAHGRAQGLRGLVQPPRRLDRARRRRLPAGRREDERGPETGGKGRVAAPGNGGERLGHEAELDRVRGRRDLQGSLPHAGGPGHPHLESARGLAGADARHDHLHRVPSGGEHQSRHAAQAHVVRAGGRPGSRAQTPPRGRPGQRSRVRRPTGRAGGRR